MLFLVAALLGCISIINCESHDLPDYFPKCNIDDPNLNNCLLDAFNAVRPYVRKGVEEIGIIPFDPVILASLNETEKTVLADITFQGWNYTIKGLDNYNIKKIRYDPETLTFFTNIEFEPLNISTFYTASGRVLHIAIEGDGFLQATLGPINSTIEIKGELVDVEGIQYYNTTNISVTLNLGDAHFDIEGLFGGHEKLGLLTNALLNEHSADVVHSLTPPFERICEDYFIKFMESFTGSVPYNKIFPKSHN